MDLDCDSKAGIFTGGIFTKDTPVFNEVKRSEHGKGVAFKHIVVAYVGVNCYIPYKGCCFINYMKYSTGRD